MSCENTGLLCLWPQWRFNNNTVNSSLNGGLDSCWTFGNQTVNMVWCIIISPSVIWNGWFGIKTKYLNKVGIYADRSTVNVTAWVWVWLKLQYH